MNCREIHVGAQTVLGALCPICRTVIYPPEALEKHEKRHFFVRQKRGSNNPAGRPRGSTRKAGLYEESIRLRWAGRS